MPARLGLIGLGFGNKHAGTLQQIENGRLAAVCDLNPERLKKATEKYGVPGYGRVEDMLEREELDGVLICTPPYVRMPLIEQLASRGLGIFCEKPPAGDLPAARAAKRAFEKHPVVNSVGFMYRWMQAADYVKALIASRPVVVCQITGIWEVLFWAKEGRISNDYFYRDRAGGPIIEQGVHLIDVARFVLGDEVARVHARGANVINPLSDSFTTEETIQVSMQWRKGTLGSHVHCWTTHQWIFQVLFAGVDFALTLDLATNQVRGKNNGEVIEKTFKDDYYRAEMEGFCDAVLKKDPELIRGNYADACHTLAVAATAMQSIDCGTDLPVPAY